MAELHSAGHMNPPIGGLLSSEPVPDPAAPRPARASSSQASDAPTVADAPTSPASPRQYKNFLPDPNPWPTRSVWYQWMPFRGMWHDLRRRAPFYLSDWTEAARPRNWERTTAATVRIYFLNVFPALAYIVDMNRRTGGAYGVNEGLLASVLAALVFSVLAVQPLTIVGVTGLINLVNYTTYDIIKRYDVDLLQFMAWSLIWSAIMHWWVAVFNVCDYSRFVTDMTGTTFGFYVGVVYISKGVELLIDEFSGGNAAGGWFSVVIAILFALCVYYVEAIGSKSFGPFWFRKLITDYSFAGSIILFTGFVHIPGYIKDSGMGFLPVSQAFKPSTDRAWLVPFWELPVKWIFAALPFGLLITVLFYFDNNVSSLMAQSRAFPVKRPAGFHWDFFLLGCTTFVSGILGLPAPNGLVPQAPVHTEALCELTFVPEHTLLTPGGYYDPTEPSSSSTSEELDANYPPSRDFQMKVVRTRVVEQRVSAFAMGLLSLGTMSGPLLHVLGLMPKAMFSGIFLVVGWASIEGNPIIHRTLFLLRDPSLTPRDHPLRKLSRAAIAKFVAVQWLFFGMIIAISYTIAGVGFPMIIIMLVPLRHFVLPNYFTAKELEALDSPTATSDAVLVSLGGPLQGERTTKNARAGAEAGRRGAVSVESGEGSRKLRRRTVEGEEGIGQEKEQAEQA